MLVILSSYICYTSNFNYCRNTFPSITFRASGVKTAPNQNPANYYGSWMTKLELKQYKISKSKTPVIESSVGMDRIYVRHEQGDGKEIINIVSG